MMERHMQMRSQKAAFMLANLGVAALLLGGCASEGGLVHRAAIGVGFGTEPPKSKEFVTETRVEEPKFIPVGTSISRPVPKKTVAEFKTMEAELDNRLNTDRASGVTAKQLGSTPPPAPPKLN
jgi:hypothetical protein